MIKKKGKQVKLGKCPETWQLKNPVTILTDNCGCKHSKMQELVRIRTRKWIKIVFSDVYKKLPIYRHRLSFTNSK